jgi:cytochrome c oxidase subunit II
MIQQSVLDAAGPQSAHIARFWWWVLGTTTIVSLVVVAFLVWAIVRGRKASAGDRSIGTAKDFLLARVVVLSVAVTIIILFALLVGSVWTGHLGASRPSNTVTIALTGHQWWWEIEYEDEVPSRRVTVANEMHIPVGRPVVIKVTSRDVIHSFWVPNLAGKRDLIPGYTTAIWLQADRTGIFRGQCAEFCGRQHAKMAIDVVAESAADFEQWLQNQRQTASLPSPVTGRGLDIFLAGQCVACHTIRGTLAHGQLGPDLTHVASRRTLGAGTLPNTREHLAEWIVDSQASKPGNRMPPNVLADADVQTLVAYLETLR